MLLSCTLNTRGMTSFVKKVEVFLWQMATVISIQSTVNHINIPCFYRQRLCMAITIISGAVVVKILESSHVIAYRITHMFYQILLITLQ